MAWEVTEQTKPFVEICVPHWGKVDLEWVEKTYSPLRWFAQQDFDKHTNLLRGILNLDTERNELVKEALKNPKATHFLFLDTDIIVEEPSDPNQALRMLLLCDAPIASGIYRARGKSHYVPKLRTFTYAMWTKNRKGDGYLPVGGWTEGTNWIKVDAIGLGFCLIKREVFEKIPYPWFKWDKPSPSEDFYFCELLQKHSYEIRVLTDVKCSHIGMLKVKPDGIVITLEV